MNRKNMATDPGLGMCPTTSGQGCSDQVFRDLEFPVNEMKYQLTLLILLLVVVFWCGLPAFAQTDECSVLKKKIESTYDFKPSELDDAGREKKIAQMDDVWNTVKNGPKSLAECLRQAIVAEGTDQWFRFDGSNLLVEVDPSELSKRIQVKAYETVDLDDVYQRVWIEVLAQRGTEGFDTSSSAVSWLKSDAKGYYLPEHAAFHIDRIKGAHILFGSMDERFAYPALFSLTRDKKAEEREIAVFLLLELVTPEALKFAQSLDTSSMSPQSAAYVDRYLKNPRVFEPRAEPKNTREEFLDAFREIEKGEWKRFWDLAEAVPDGERDVVAVLKCGDIPLVRKVRRISFARSSPHGLELQESFRRIILTLEMKCSKQASVEKGE